VPPLAKDRTWTAEEVLEALPHGVVIVESGGDLVHANPAAKKLVAGLGGSEVRRCSDLFCCRAADGPCARTCLVERAAGSDVAAPEVRIDTPGGHTPGALWVTAAPVPDSAGTLAILHLRPGERGDRRKRSDVRWLTGPDLRIWAFGPTHVEALNDSLDGQWLRQRPGQVLKYLLCNRSNVVLVDEIADSIWPGSGRQTVSNARYVIHQLREKLEPRRPAHDSPAFVLAQSGGYTLNRERVWIDVDEFESAVDEGRAAMARMDSAAARRAFDYAIDLYRRGDFLADDPYAEWAVDERHRLAGLASYALRVAIALAHERDDSVAAVTHLDRLAELEPFDSGVHRELIAALLGDGLRTEAKRRYDRFAERVLREFGEPPEFDLSSLRDTADGET
jgi:DNA-binding SARP family transcriptional activator